MGCLIGIHKQTVGPVAPAFRVLEGRGDLGNYSPVDLMGKTDDGRGRRLTKYFGQTKTGNQTSGHQVAQNVAGPNRRQLVGIANKKQLAIRWNGSQQGGAKADI